jgi:hypothetical protein
VTAGACLLIWCLGAHTPEPRRVVVAQDTYRKGGETARVLLAESRGLMAGWVFQPSIRDAALVGWWLLRLHLGRLSADGGAVMGTAPFPRRGTRANWAARFRLNVTRTLGLEYVHFSNSGAGRPNPSLDSFGLSVGF